MLVSSIAAKKTKQRKGEILEWNKVNISVWWLPVLGHNFEEKESKLWIKKNVIIGCYLFGDEWTLKMIFP